jgi:hypothetical protein
MSRNRFQLRAQPQAATLRSRHRRARHGARPNAPLPTFRWRRRSDSIASNRPTPDVRGELPETRPSLLLRVTALIMLCGFLVFAHGCHGDEDNELFARIITIVAGK